MPADFSAPTTLPAELTELHELRQLMQRTPHPIVRLSPSGQLVYTNEAALALLASLGPAEHPQVLHQLAEASATAPDQSLQVGQRFFEVQAVAAATPPGGTILYLVETTEQVLAERQLAEQRTLLEQIIDVNPHAIFVRNAQGDIVFENRATRDIRLQTGYLHPAATQPPTSQQARELAEAHASDAHVLHSGQQMERESTVTLASGEQRWLRTVKRLLVRPTGERQVLGISTDITAQHQAMHELALRDKQYRDLLTYSQALIFTHDLAGHLLSVNPAGAALLGRPAEVLLGRPLAEGVRPEYREAVADYLRQIADSGTFRGVAALAQPASAEPRYVLCYTKLVSETGQTPYVIGYAQDITERIKAERTLKQAKEAAEAAVQARENFLANMSHEIRTPLNGVLGMAAQLARTPLDGRQQEFLGTIRTAGQHLLRVINDVLDMAKISSGKLELESVAFNLCDSMAGALQPLVAQAQEKGLHFEGIPLRASCAHPWVLSDPHRLNQILLNLVANAIKFTPVGGRIKVVGEQLSEAADTLTVRFSVEDTGIGIAADKQDAIFEGFTQAYADTTRRFGGTGLGLSISRALVTQLGGTLTLSSAPGQGSTFAFTLTLSKAPAPVAEVAPSAYDTGALRGRRVLVVEDNEINRTVARLLLEDWGVVVEEAEDGRAGVARVQHDEPYDVVLMDIQLPGLNGLDATAAIRALPDAARAAVPVVALTANAFQSDRERYLAAGMQACLAKPFEEESMYNTLLQVLPTPAPAVSYDLSRLHSLARGRQAFVRKIIEAFLRNMPASIAELRAAAEAGHWPEAAKITHHIRPSLESLGVTDVVEPIGQLEAHPLHNPASLQAAATHLIKQVERALAELPGEL